jgi:hypothetical protein
VFQESFPGYGLWFGHSVDGGATWTGNIQLADGSASFSSFDNMSGTLVGGLPAILFTESSTLKGAVAKDALGADWNPAVDVAGFPFALQSALAQDGAGSLTIAWRDSTSVQVLTNFDFTTGLGTGPVPVGLNVKYFNLLYNPLTANYEITYADDAGQLSFTASADGVLWSPPVVIASNAQPSNCGMSLADIGGQPAAAWFGADGGTHQFPIWYAASANGGASWSLPQQVGTTSASFNPVGQVTLLDAGGQPLLLAPDPQGSRTTVYELR